MVEAAQAKEYDTSASARGIVSATWIDIGRVVNPRSHAETSLVQRYERLVRVALTLINGVITVVVPNIDAPIRSSNESFS